MHPYIAREPVSSPAEDAAALAALNRDRESPRGPAVEVTYWYSVDHRGARLAGLAARGEDGPRARDPQALARRGRCPGAEARRLRRVHELGHEHQPAGARCGRRLRVGAGHDRLPSRVLRPASRRETRARAALHGHGERAVLGLLVLPGREDRRRPIPAGVPGPVSRAALAAFPGTTVPRAGRRRADHRDHREAQDRPDPRAVLAQRGRGREGRRPVHQGRREHAPLARRRATVRRPGGEGSARGGVRPRLVEDPEGHDGSSSPPTSPPIPT